MAQFSAKIMRLTGSVLGENQHTVAFDRAALGFYADHNEEQGTWTAAEAEYFRS